MFYLTILCTLCLLCISILLRFFFREQDGNQMVVYFQYLVVLMV